MLKSSLFCLRRFDKRLLIGSLEWKRSAASKITKPSKLSRFKPDNFFKDVDRSRLMVQYESIPELDAADERVKKLFTIAYGNSNDVYRKKNEILKSKLQLRATGSCASVVDRIVQLTVDIKVAQKRYFLNRTKFKRFKFRFYNLYNKRAELLEELRTYHYEVYVQILETFDIKHQFEPEYRIGKAPLADEVADMRIRSFAHSRNLEAQKEARWDTLSDAIQGFKEQLEKGELALKDESENMYDVK
ncbi:small ribosomal subunit protein uS15m-like [Clavelina lepadiformis]|uniref:small ribosomal subunit protein uS15m-like n=1 Tax=Clavelina lepadiformis TaxID=159417 RepID=UPI00404306AA